GYGPFQYLEVLKRYGIKRKPKYALFCFYEGNDILDIRAYLDWRAGGNYHNSSKVLSSTFLQRYILAVSGIAQYFGNNISLEAALLFSKMRKNEYHIHQDIVAVNIKNKSYEMLLSHKNNIGSIDEIIKSEEWKSLKEILLEFKDIC